MSQKLSVLEGKVNGMENDVFSIYNALQSKGYTPLDSTVGEIINAIDKMYYEHSVLNKVYCCLSDRVTATYYSGWRNATYRFDVTGRYKYIVALHQGRPQYDLGVSMSGAGTNVKMFKLLMEVHNYTVAYIEVSDPTLPFEIKCSTYTSEPDYGSAYIYRLVLSYM